MSVIFVPNTQVNLLNNVDLRPDYQDTFDFADVNSQTNFFMSKVKFKFYEEIGSNERGFTYQREKSSIRIPKEYDEIIDCSYVMYKNKNFSDKWFYGFITQINYINQNVSEVIFQLDVMQTWAFDFTLKRSMVEREIVQNDIPFTHLYEEGLQFGPIITKDIDFFSLEPIDIGIAIAPTSINDNVGYLIDGTYSGLNYRYFRIDAIEEINSLIKSYYKAGKLDGIVALFAIPSRFHDKFSDVFPQKKTIEINDTTLNGYTPRNKKLLQYPYRYLAINNCQGNEVIYRYEFFANPYKFIFNMSFTQSISATCNFHPMDYEGRKENWDRCVVLDNFPMLSWVGNTFANWFARNKTSYAMSAVTGALNAGVSAATNAIGGNIVGAATSGLSGITGALNNLAEMRDRSLFPYEIRGQISSNVSNIKWERVGFEIIQYSITKEYAIILDDFFTKYGYKIMRLKVPDTKGRKNWNYVKTLGCEVNANIPNEHLEIIRNNFDRGITFWHGDYIGDYSKTNAPTSTSPAPIYPEPTEPDEPPAPPPVNPDPSDWSVPWPGWTNDITSHYGYRTNPITGESQFHNGTDVGAPTGTNIHAIAAGTVVNVSENEYRGKFIRVMVNERFVYLYQHCNTISKKIGDRVMLNEIIATVGSTGQVTGPHLHIEIYDNDNTVNPVTFLEGVG